MDLSLNLKSIVSQRLIPNKDRCRIPAVEILLNSSRVSDLIIEGNIGEIKDVMKKSNEIGMKTFDQALLELFENDHITYNDAIRNSDSPNDLALAIKLRSSNKGIQEVNEFQIKDL